MPLVEKPDRSNWTITIILAAFAIACGVLFWYLSANMQHFIAKNPQKLELRFREAKRFTTEQKKAFLESHAGFWTGRSEIATGKQPIRETDLLEFKKNGIIWEVVSWEVPMPSGATVNFRQVRTAYIDPYGTLKGDTLNDAYALHQTFIRAKDTCFGAYNFPPELWRISKSGESLIMNRRKFERYTGEISSFFPAGMVNLVGIAGAGSNPYLKKIGDGPVGKIEMQKDGNHSSTNALNMPGCEEMQNLRDVFRNELAWQFSVQKPVIADSAAAIDLLQRYYEPLLLNEQLRIYPWPLPASVQVGFTISREGVPGDISVTGDADKILQGEVAREIASWRLPRAEKAIRISKTMMMP